MTGNELRQALGVDGNHDLFEEGSLYCREAAIPETEEKITLSLLRRLITRPKHLTARHLVERVNVHHLEPGQRLGLFTRTDAPFTTVTVSSVNLEERKVHLLWPLGDRLQSTAPNEVGDLSPHLFYLSGDEEPYMALSAQADAYAVWQHRGQIGKDDHPYIEHPRAVAQILASAEGRALAARWGVDLGKAQAVALLHDTMEDGTATPEGLQLQGFPPDVIEGVVALTRLDGESYMAFVRRAKQNKLSRLAKWGDLKHNQDRTRLKVITDEDEARFKKYAKAERLLLEEDEKQ